MLHIGGLFIAMAALFVAQSSIADVPRFGPIDKVASLLNQPNDVYTFIVRAEADKLRDVADQLQIDGRVDLPLIDGWALELPVSRAHSLSQRSDVRQVWYLRPDEAPIYISVIENLSNTVRNDRGPIVVNLSIGPPASSYSRTPDPYHPVHLATRRAAEAGIILVIAAGNFGRKDGKADGLINPWCLPEWVICVGAARRDGNGLWDQSSRGLPDDPDTWPDFVAPGTDQIVSRGADRTPKTWLERRRDESNPVFRESVPREEWDTYTIVSGTSFAAPHVAYSAGHILRYMIMKTRQNTLRLLEGASVPGASISPYLKLSIPRYHLEITSRGKPRLAGTIIDQGEESVSIVYEVDHGWKTIKQILRDIAIPMPNYDPHQVGSGLVSRYLIEEVLDEFGVMKIDPGDIKRVDLID